MAPFATPPIPVTQLDQADPALLEELLEVVARVARRAPSRWATSSRPSRRSSPPTARRRPRGRRLVGHRGDRARAARARHRPRRRGDRPDELVHRDRRGRQPGRRDAAAGRRRSRDAPDHRRARSQAAIGPRTRCVIPVHLMGSTVDLDPILEVARAAGLRVIEDSAQAHGARYHRGRRVGTFGDLGCFSMYPTKNLGAWGDGGAVVSADAELADRVRLLRSHGERPRYHHRSSGTTARLDALQAALLRVKLRRLDGWNDDRRRLGAALREGLAGTSVELPRRLSRAPTTSTTCSSRARSAGGAARLPRRARHRDRGALPDPDPPDRRLRRSSSARAACPWPSGSPSRSARCRSTRRCPTTRSRGSSAPSTSSTGRCHDRSQGLASAASRP